MVPKQGCFGVLELIRHVGNDAIVVVGASDHDSIKGDYFLEKKVLNMRETSSREKHDYGGCLECYYIYHILYII